MPTPAAVFRQSRGKFEVVDIELDEPRQGEYDRYVKQDGRWVFAYRDHAFMYAVPSESLSGLAREKYRVRWPSAAAPHAEWAPRSV